MSEAATIPQRMGARMHIVTAFGAHPSGIAEEPPEELEWLTSAGVRADFIVRHASSAVAVAGVDAALTIDASGALRRARRSHDVTAPYVLCPPESDR